MFVFLCVFSRPSSKYKLHIHGVYSEKPFLTVSASGINCKFYFIGFRFVYISFNELSLQNIKCHFLCLSRSKHEEDQLYTLIFWGFQLKKNEKKKKIYSSVEDC